MNLIKIMAINILIVLALLGTIILAPPIMNLTYQFLKQNADQSSGVTRGDLALYDSFEWAAKHFEEFKSLQTTYYDYITWRRDDYNGETINITDGLRHTPISSSLNKSATTYWFFGGSTTWGTGVSDLYTYPTIFAHQKKADVVNFGESGYIARQSLAYMLNHLISNNIQDLSNVHVVFFDGLNDVASRCRSEIAGLGTERETQIQKFLDSSGADGSVEKYDFKRTFAQLSDFLAAIVRRIGNVGSEQLYAESLAEKLYSCSKDNERAAEVAETLVRTWQAASDSVESRGGKFTAILQPVAFYGDADFSYLNLTTPNDQALSQQYETVYPLVTEIAKRSGLGFIDVTKVYDGCGECYIDFAHVGPQAHQLLVDRLIVSLNE